VLKEKLAKLPTPQKNKKKLDKFFAKVFLQ
jgi:hypothetical protein